MAETSQHLTPNTHPPVGIVSAGTYIPRNSITAAEMAELTGIPEEVIMRKFGLTRKPVAGPDEHTNAMAVWAAQDALSQSGISPEEIDVVLCTTEEYKEYPLWTAGIKLAYDIGATRAWAVDVQMRCGTTVAALRMAKALMLAETNVHTVLIAGGYRNGDLVDYANPRTRFLINLSAGAGALLLQRDYPRNHLLGSAVIVDGSFSLDVIVPAGGTVEPLTPEGIAAHRYMLDVPDPEGMKERLDKTSMQNFLRVIDMALAESGYTRPDIGYLNVLHMKRSAHDFVLRELGLRDDQTCYLSDFGHIGQQDAMVSIKMGVQSGRLKDGDLMVIVAAGIGYAWGASVIKWGQDFSLEGRVAVITGGANGIGKQTALLFAEAGASVAIWDMVEGAGQAHVEETDGGKAAFFKTNVASQPEVEASVEATLARFGKIDILINNAGITRDAQLIKIKDGEMAGKMTEADFDAVIAVNLKGVFNCTQAIAPHMIAQGYGRIVSASSVVGIYGNFGQTNYVATKAGVIGMTKVWARELGKRGITVNAVAPGFIGTDMVRGMPDHVLQEMIAHTPVGRMGQPEDVAYAYLFLACEEASFINGAVLSVDGGLVVGT